MISVRSAMSSVPSALVSSASNSASLKRDSFHGTPER